MANYSASNDCSTEALRLLGCACTDFTYESNSIKNGGVPASSIYVRKPCVHVHLESRTKGSIDQGETRQQEIMGFVIPESRTSIYVHLKCNSSTRTGRRRYPLLRFRKRLLKRAHIAYRYNNRTSASESEKKKEDSPRFSLHRMVHI
jgi:hypothetical protein